MPRVSIEAVARYMDMINMLPVHYQGQVASNVQTIRRRMANEFGCDPEEMALTRERIRQLERRALGKLKKHSLLKAWNEEVPCEYAGVA